MSNEEKVKQAIEYIRQQPKEYKDRDWYTRTQQPAERVESSHRDWSGSSWGGRDYSGSRWSGGRGV